jgi:hypothetical protein
VPDQLVVSGRYDIIHGQTGKLPDLGRSTERPSGRVSCRCIAGSPALDQSAWRTPGQTGFLGLRHMPR